MPLTPFVGLSTFLHLFVILWKKFIGWKLPAMHYTGKFKLIFQAGILLMMTVIFSGIMFGAISLIVKSTEDKHSSIQIVKNSAHFLIDK